MTNHEVVVLFDFSIDDKDIEKHLQIQVFDSLLFYIAHCFIIGIRVKV